MAISDIPFMLPEDFRRELANQSIARFGAILKDTSTGRIFGHLQETGALDAVRQTAFATAKTSISPILSGADMATGIAGIVQNEQIKSRLADTQSMLGSVQALQVGTLAVSLAGVGVTAASTAILLKRMSGLKAQINDIGDTLDGLSKELRDTSVADTFSRIETALERLDEAPGRSDTARVLLGAAEKLHESTSALFSSIAKVSRSEVIEPAFLLTMLDALALANAAQIRALIWLDEKDAAFRRSGVQFEKIMSLSEDLVQHRLISRIEVASDRDAIGTSLSELRMRVASQPSLCTRLISGGINGRAYIEAATNEDTHPILLLPAA